MTADVIRINNKYSSQQSTELISVKAALALMKATFSPLEPVAVPISTANQRILAMPIQAMFDLPAYNNSAMDGFAVIASDIKYATENQPVELTVIGDIPAGTHYAGTLESNQALRIMTGAAIPEGADSVVPVEQTDVSYRNPSFSLPSTVKVFQSFPKGAYIRPKGQDVHKGEIVLDAGVKIKPQEIGLLSMLGYSTVRIHRAPKVAILSTGDELIDLELPLASGKIYDSNSHMLSGLLTQAGCLVFNLGIASDNIDVVNAKLSEAYDEHVDLIISTAGVSVGAFDYVRSVLERYGTIDFWRVNMRPGKPLLFGSYKGIPFAGLPGNPVSAFIGFEVFIRPVIQNMSGDLNWVRNTYEVKIEEDIFSDGRESYLRGIVCRREGDWVAQLTGHQGSGNLRSLVQANALLIIPSGVKSLPAGARILAWPLNADEF